MSECKKKGRPRKFDADDALEKAIKVFWKKGYEGASLSDLTKEMGINGPSLYSAFGSKYDLFIKSIHAYINRKDCGPITYFENEPDIKKAVRLFFKDVINTSVDCENGTSGCYLGSCVSTNAGEFDDVKELLQVAIKATEDLLIKRFEKEKKAGALPKDFPSKQKARLMFDIRQGFTFRARAGMTHKELSRDLDETVNLILST